MENYGAAWIIFNFPFSISYKHEVTPNEVPIAVRIVINVWIIIPQMFFFFIIK